MSRADSLRALIDAFEIDDLPDDLGRRLAQLSPNEQFVFSAWVFTSQLRDGIGPNADYLTPSPEGLALAKELLAGRRAAAVEESAVARLLHDDKVILTAIIVAEHARQYGFASAVTFAGQSRR
jgi:hypothetical protein